MICPSCLLAPHRAFCSTSLPMTRGAATRAEGGQAQLRLRRATCGNLAGLPCPPSLQAFPATRGYSDRPAGGELATGRCPLAAASAAASHASSAACSLYIIQQGALCRAKPVRAQPTTPRPYLSSALPERFEAIVTNPSSSVVRGTATFSVTGQPAELQNLEFWPGDNTLSFPVTFAAPGPKVCLGKD